MTIKITADPHIKVIIDTLQQAGFETYVVGGAIRDLMLDRKPKDYDLSTSASPEQVRQVFGRRRARIIGRRFKLVHLYNGKEIIEISTFRRRPAPKAPAKVNPKYGEAPENMIFHDNEYGTSEEDAFRRDFTVNALFFDPVSGEIIDHTGYGIEDIQNGKVRVIGDPALRFEEDPVRLLRALKLVGQYGFTMTDETASGLRESLELITHASHSRLTLELEKILKNTYSSDILTAFHDYGFLGYFLPFLGKNWETPAGIYAMQLLGERDKRLRQGLYRDSISLAMAAISLPFVEQELGDGEKGSLWLHKPYTDAVIRDIVDGCFMPHHMIKRLDFAAQRTLMMQPWLLDSDNPKKLVNRRGYAHARELLMLQNNVVWQSEELENMWPRRMVDHAAHNFDKKKKRSRRPRRRGPQKPN
jgi:poly(A) polymerase